MLITSQPLSTELSKKYEKENKTEIDAMTDQNICSQYIGCMVDCMERKEKTVILPCDCKCCMFVIEKTIWENCDISYNITVQDSRYDHNYNTLWGRIKRAVKALLGKPVYFNDVHLEGEERYIKLVADMTELIGFN
ncbi:MAG: hypothetical protein LBD23_19485 [Oscillospiraceae bacterium]|nr:hypothetical protein [Oscillospiraceae bacterium]